MKKIFLLFFVLFHNTLNAQFEGIEIGKSVESLDSTKISNKIAGDDTYLDYSEFKFYGQKPESATLSFYHNRLFAVSMKFPESTWDILIPKITEKYGKTWSGKIEKAGSYWGDTKAITIKMTVENNQLLVDFSDYRQKEMNFSDWMSPMVLYPILAIIGMFIIYLVLGWFYTSRCPKCKSFSLELLPGVELGKNVDYNLDISPLALPENYHDKTYTYKCKKCGHIHKETHSGWWQWYANKNK